MNDYRCSFEPYAISAYAYLEYAIFECRSQQILPASTMAVRFKVDLKEIGSRIKKMRSSMLQEELAAYLDVSQGHLSKIESGKIAPSLEALVLLSAKFHKTVDWIIRGDGS